MQWCILALKEQQYIELAGKQGVGRNQSQVDGSNANGSLANAFSNHGIYHKPNNHHQHNQRNYRKCNGNNIIIDDNNHNEHDYNRNVQPIKNNAIVMLKLKPVSVQLLLNDCSYSICRNHTQITP